MPMGALGALSDNNMSSAPATTASSHPPRRMSGGTWKSRFVNTTTSKRASSKESSSRASSPAASKTSSSNRAAAVGEESIASESLSSSRRSARMKKGMRGRIRNLLSSSPSRPSVVSREESPSHSSTPTVSFHRQQQDLAVATTTTAETSTDKQEINRETQTQPAQNEVAKNIQEKREIKERDGFCRRVDHYDGQVIVVDQKPTYELGNYLGGGVAGVVYEGHRLRPMEEYPVRGGLIEEEEALQDMTDEPQLQLQQLDLQQQQEETSTFLCGDSLFSQLEETSPQRTHSLTSKPPLQTPTRSMTPSRHMAMDVAIETTDDQNQVVLVDAMDAPSRTKLQAAKKAAEAYPLTDETVAIKILNPVGFRILPPDETQTAVIVKTGEDMPEDVRKGLHPMEEKHVWWLVNPNSRNLRTLQRSSERIERGTPEKGLRLSLVAAYVDPKTHHLRELPLTRCIEIWGHVPFSASDEEFEQMMETIERINAGHVPAPVLLNSSPPPSRVGTDTTSSSLGSYDGSHQQGSPLSIPSPLSSHRTGLYRAAATSRTTVFCEALNAYIAVPSVPPKYLRWLRQRRAATKEIRNMMLIGRHRNVVHLYEVLELIQDSKSTMFLVLELVRGGELFDLISSNAAKISPDKSLAESESTMRKFFRELASGVHYCHANGIAHRDLKPENLLVHTSPSGQCTLKIADFGLSATFAITNAGASDDTVMDSKGSAIEFERFSSTFSSRKGDISTPPSVSSASKPSSPLNSIAALGASALSLLNCGSMENVISCGIGSDEDSPPSPLRRMTSVVGSPHYVAPEIISQHDERHEGASRRKKKPTGPGYDGTKADVWSAGVILYAMLFRSLPFGEDLLRCPRYQSFSRWYEEAQRAGGRRSSAQASLSPRYTDADERDMLGPHWFFPSQSSRESRDLIVAMLNPNPDERLSVDMVLKHPWFFVKKDAT